MKKHKPLLCLVSWGDDFSGGLSWGLWFSPFSLCPLSSQSLLYNNFHSGSQSTRNSSKQWTTSESMNFQLKYQIERSWENKLSYREGGQREKQTHSFATFSSWWKNPHWKREPTIIKEDWVAVRRHIFTCMRHRSCFIKYLHQWDKRDIWFINVTITLILVLYETL